VTKQIYVNLPVKDLKRSMAFFTAEDPDGHSWELICMEPDATGQA
jgi:predicted lactoylglutathione lyase